MGAYLFSAYCNKNTNPAYNLKKPKRLQKIIREVGK